MAVTLVTGPVRSGKSRYAAALAEAGGRRVRYVATALRDAGDAEWNARLERHSLERPASWEVIESAALSQEALLDVFRNARENECLIVDALGTWLAARIALQLEAFERDVEAFEALMDAEAADLAYAMLASPAQVIVVAEEIGWDVVPVVPSARLFRDVIGRMKQHLAGHAEAAMLLVCGIALNLTALGSRPAD